jgi:hypothetical protein
VSVPLLATHHGDDELAVSPHGLTRFGSVVGAAPLTSDTSECTEYALSSAARIGSAATSTPAAIANPAPSSLGLFRSFAFPLSPARPGREFGSGAETDWRPQSPRPVKCVRSWDRRRPHGSLSAWCAQTPPCTLGVWGCTPGAHRHIKAATWLAKAKRDRRQRDAAHANPATD